MILYLIYNFTAKIRSVNRHSTATKNERISRTLWNCTHSDTLGCVCVYVCCSVIMLLLLFFRFREYFRQLFSTRNVCIMGKHFRAYFRCPWFLLQHGTGSNTNKQSNVSIWYRLFCWSTRTICFIGLITGWSVDHLIQIASLRIPIVHATFVSIFFLCNHSCCFGQYHQYLVNRTVNWTNNKMLQPKIKLHNIITTAELMIEWLRFVWIDKVYRVYHFEEGIQLTLA